MSEVDTFLCAPSFSLARTRLLGNSLTTTLRRWLFPPEAPVILESISSRDNNYTLIRLILASSVIYYHAFAISDDPLHRMDAITALLLPAASLGGIAVNGFFFLSGLFVTQSYQKDPNVFHFVIKRFLRIWPGLFVCIAVTEALSALFSQPTAAWRYLAFSDFYQHIVQNSILQFEWTLDGVWSGHRYTSLNGSIHTLAPEAWMYVWLAVAGVAGLLASRRQTTRFGLAAIALIALLYCSGSLSRFMPNDADGWMRATMFFAGVCACGVADRLCVSRLQGALLIAICVVTRGFVQTLAVYVTVAWALLYFGQAAWIGRIVRRREDLSYGVYIYGWPATQIALHFTSLNVNPYVLTVLSLILSLAFAAASWRYVEAPAIALGQALAKANFGFVSLRASDAWPQTVRDGVTFSAIAASFVFCVLAAWALDRLDALFPFTEMPVRIIAYGPETGRAGRVLNRQPDGRSAIWMKLDGAPEKDATYVFVEGRRMDTAIGNSSATATVEEDILATRGAKRVYLETVHFDRRLPLKQRRIAYHQIAAPLSLRA